jgi:hypothetical protein
MVNEIGSLKPRFCISLLWWMIEPVFFWGGKDFTVCVFCCGMGRFYIQWAILVLGDLFAYSGQLLYPAFLFLTVGQLNAFCFCLVTQRVRTILAIRMLLFCLSIMKVSNSFDISFFLIVV